MLKVLASALTVAAAPAAAPTPCPSGMVSMGETPDGAWAVCERTLTKDALSGDLVPAGELRFVHRNGTARSFRKTSKAVSSSLEIGIVKAHRVSDPGQAYRV